MLQTFQDFEVIVVDDCSTDNSVAVVESYVPKFNGRLRLEKTEKNSGGGGYVPRNIGLGLASGEYVYFVDSDDFILLTALETLYNAAKEYNADVVYTGSYYEMKNPNDIYIHRDGEGKKLFKDGLEDKLDFRVDDQKGNLNRLLLEEFEGNFRNPWSKFLRHDFLTENKIQFPAQMTTGGDFIWVINVYCHSKRFLRLPARIYFYRNNNASVTKTKRKPSEQISYWISAFIDFVKNLRALENENEILQENPAYCLSAFKSHFEWCLVCTSTARSELSDKDIYEALHQKFVKNFSGTISDERNIDNDLLKQYDELKREVARLNNSPLPAISVIIPLYNAEKYVGECLDSLLFQTFQDFEVIVVDDCSTDNSVAVVESYAPKFNGRLKIFHMEKNTGSGALPRNKGLSFSRGEYIQFLDADDKLTKTALEEMYTLAKDYDADVVYCEKFYEVNSVGGNTKISSYQKGDFIKKPTLEPENLKERVQRIVNEKYLSVPWNKFVKRSLIADNEIFFPAVKISEDNIWNQGLIFCTKKFLRVPNIVYIYRSSETSIQKINQTTPQQTIKFWLNPVLLGLKYLDKMMNRHEFFLANPSCRYALLKKFVETRFNWSLRSARKLKEDVIYSTIKDEFGEKLGEYDVLIPALCASLYNDKKAYTNAETLLEFINYLTSATAPQFFTARIDVKFESPEQGDFQIVSVSDDKAAITNPAWFQKDGVGYIIQSKVGKLEIVVKATSDGQINFNIKGISAYNPNDKTKRIPHWVGYTKFTVNENTVFDKLTPAWHDKPYRHKMETKANDEITMRVEWLTQRINITPYDENAEIINKFKDYLTARVDVKLEATEQGDFQIVSVSDERAVVKKAGWLSGNEIGYRIQSYVGKLKIIAKPTADGQISLDLRGLDIRNAVDKSKRIPYWVDYKKLTVNGKIIFDALTPVWHDKPYRHKMNAKANDEIIVEVEWLPHKDNRLDISKDVATTKKDDKAIRESKDHLTARVDVKLVSNGEGDLKIVSVSDDKAKIRKATWLAANEIGYFVQSHVGKMEIVAKVIGGGQFNLDLRGMDIRDPADKSKRIPYWVDYTKLTVNGEFLFDALTPVWHDKPYRYKMEANADEEIIIEVEWLPHRGDT